MTAVAGEQLTDIHRMFRREFWLLADLVRRTPHGDTHRAARVGAHVDLLLSALHNHHGIEEDYLWPLLAARAGILTSGPQAGYETVARYGERVVRLLDAWRAAPATQLSDALVSTLVSLAATLTSYLDEVEATILPLVRSHVGAEEWAEFGRRRDAVRGIRKPPNRAGRAVWRNLNRLAIALYQRSDGRIGGSAKGLPVLLITVPGRVTGRPHIVPVVYFEHDGGYVVTGSSGGAPAEPQWLRNLRVSELAQVRIGGTTFAVTARVTLGAERDRLWRDVVLARAAFFARYQEKSGRVIPVAVLRRTTGGAP